ncbi:hypothetical protein ACFSTC_33980 [Nonomuraea ferruginea]
MVQLVNPGSPGPVDGPTGTGAGEGRRVDRTGPGGPRSHHRAGARALQGGAGRRAGRGGGAGGRRRGAAVDVLRREGLRRPSHSEHRLHDGPAVPERGADPGRGADPSRRVHPGRGARASGAHPLTGSERPGRPADPGRVRSSTWEGTADSEMLDRKFEDEPVAITLKEGESTGTWHAPGEDAGCETGTLQVTEVSEKKLSFRLGGLGGLCAVYDSAERHAGDAGAHRRQRGGLPADHADGRKKK